MQILAYALDDATVPSGGRTGGSGLLANAALGSICEASHATPVNGRTGRNMGCHVEPQYLLHAIAFLTRIHQTLPNVRQTYQSAKMKLNVEAVSAPTGFCWPLKDWTCFASCGANIDNSELLLQCGRARLKDDPKKDAPL